MPGKIFINYRRAESLKDARHLATLLDKGPFRGRIFIDLRGLDGSSDWLHELERQVAASEAMVSVICPGWAEVRDADGLRRIDSDHDFVRFELAEAFRRGIPVIPVLVDGARMPRGSELPDNLLLLTRPQAELLRAESFDDDVNKIVRRVQADVAARRVRGWPGWAVVAIAGVALAGGVGVGSSVPERLGWSRPVVTDAQATGMIAQLRSELAAAKAEIGRLASAKDAALKEAAAQRTIGEGSAKELSHAKSEADVAAKRAVVSEKARSEAVAEAKRLTGVLAAAEKAHDAATARTDGLEKQAAALQAQVSALTAELASLKRSPAAPLPPPQVPAAARGGETFRDCQVCPEMVVVPAGSFMMGSPESEVGPTRTKVRSAG